MSARNCKPIVFADLIYVAEYDGKPVAFMITLPDINEKLKQFDGKLFPFNWAKLLWWLRAPQVRTMRVPLMGVAKHLQNSRMASQLAFMMIEYIRRNSVANFGATRGEIGWILEDNQGHELDRRDPRRTGEQGVPAVRQDAVGWEPSPACGRGNADLGACALVEVGEGSGAANVPYAAHPHPAYIKRQAAKLQHPSPTSGRRMQMAGLVAAASCLFYD